jgi:hypothetical protein
MRGPPILSPNALSSGAGDLSPQSSARSRVRPHVSNGRSVSTVVSPPVFPLRYREITNAIMLDQGGPDRCSETRQQLIRRFAAASCFGRANRSAAGARRDYRRQRPRIVVLHHGEHARVLGRDQTHSM